MSILFSALLREKYYLTHNLDFNRRKRYSHSRAKSMSCLQCYSGIHRRLRWERFWPRLLILLVAIIEMLLTIAILCLEFWSMIINIKYSFFFIGFIASFIHIITWILTFIVSKFDNSESRVRRFSCACFRLLLSNVAFMHNDYIRCSHSVNCYIKYSGVL